MDNQPEVLTILKKLGGLITHSHIIGTSGKHLDAYVNKDALYPHTKETSAVCRMMAEQVKHLQIDAVVSPALGGIVLSQWVAYHLSEITGREVLGIYAEKDSEKNMIFTRGYDKLISGKNILVVEDVANTGGSAKKTAEAVKAIGGKVVAVSVMVNRNPEIVTEEFFAAPLFALAELKLSAYSEDECPMCKNGLPINTQVGHGKKYLESKNLK